MSTVDPSVWRSALLADRRIGFVSLKVADMLLAAGFEPMTQEQIADAMLPTIVSSSQVQEATKRLRQRGFLSVERLPTRRVVYHPAMPQP